MAFPEDVFIQPETFTFLEDEPSKSDQVVIQPDTSLVPEEETPISDQVDQVSTQPTANSDLTWTEYNSNSAMVKTEPLDIETFNFDTPGISNNCDLHENNNEITMERTQKVNHSDVTIFEHKTNSSQSFSKG